MDSLFKLASIGGGIAAFYSHKGKTDVDKFRRGNNKKKKEAVVGSMIGASLAKSLIPNNGLLGSFIIGSGSAVGARILTGQSKREFEKPALLIGACSTVGDIIGDKFPRFIII